LSDFIEHPTDPPKPSRRALLAWLVGLYNFVVAAAVIGPVVGFITAPLRRRAPQKWVPLMDDGDLAVGETREVKFVVSVKDGYVQKDHEYAVFLRRSQDGVIAFDPACTHLGCRIKWQGDKDRYLCPCHGGVFDAKGAVVSGPPPKPLIRHPVKIEKGKILVEWRT